MAKAAREQHTPRYYWPIVLVLLIVAAAVFYLRLPILDSLRGLAFDAYQRAAPAPDIEDSPIKVIHIDEASLERLGQWPWSRTTLAELTRQLGEAGAAAIVFDVLFAEPDRTSPEHAFADLTPRRRAAVMRALGASQSHDEQFAAVLSNYPTVLSASLHDQPSTAAFPMHAGLAVNGDDPDAYLRDYPGLATNLPELSDAAAAVGFINWLPDRDQVVRRVPLLLQHDGQIVPSLSLEALRIAVGASTYIVRTANANATEAFGANTGLDSIRVGPITVPTDAEGQIWVRFRRYDAEQAIPAWQVLEGEADISGLRGAIVLIGASAPGLLDLRATPLDASIPGVEIHRQVLEQIVTDNFLARPDFARGIELLLTLLIVLALAFAAPRFRPSINGAITAACLAALWIAGFVLFANAGYLFDPVFPSLAALIFSGGATTYFYQRTQQQRETIRRAFSHYVEPNVVRQLTAHPERLKLGGEVRELTVLMCDIRSFSSIAERLNAEQLTAFINSFLTPVSDIIIAHGGTIDKYIGDAVLAFWNAPLDQPDHAQRACQATLQIMSRLAELNREWRQEAEAAGRPFEDVRIGIGVSTGQCCVGNLGSDRRFDYSAIGDTVNIAARLESLTKVYGLTLLVSDSTLDQAPDPRFFEVGLVRLKGREGATRIFTALADGQSPLPEHAPFLEAFHGADFETADELLAGLEANSPRPLNQLYAHYRKRLDAAPTSAEWDGIFDPDHK